MIGMMSRQFYNVGRTYCTASTISSLGKLRKITGYSISNCKRALEMFPDNLQKAEEWLHSEAKSMGWLKWSKIQNKSAAQGLIGVYVENNIGAMVEVNCETDFVAKNIEFKHLVQNILLGCFDQFVTKSEDNDVGKYVLSEDALMNLSCRTFDIKDLLNTAMSKFNEKTVLKKAAFLKTTKNSDFIVAGLTHPTENVSGVSLGKFGALVAYQQNEATHDEMTSLGSNLCQHIIGMNPSSIGNEDFLQLYRSGKIRFGNEETNIEIVPEENEVEDSFKSEFKDSDETRLLFQSYLFDPNLHVYDYTWKKIDVLNFERFECGAEQAEENKKSVDIRQ